MENKIIYGTLEECVNELWKLIDFENAVFPDFNFAIDVDEDAKSPEEAYQTASDWFGVKDLGYQFDADTISIMIGYYGGGGVESMELTLEYEESEKEIFIEKIISSANAWVDLKRQDKVVFEIEAK